MAEEQKHISLYNQYVKNTSGWEEVDNVTVAEYVWIDGSGIILRSKCKTIEGRVTSLEDIPEWNFDGSSCYMADTENSEIIIKPVAYFRDPFRRAHHIIVMCETFKWTDNTFQ